VRCVVSYVSFTSFEFDERCNASIQSCLGRVEYWGEGRGHMPVHYLTTGCDWVWESAEMGSSDSGKD
jgi:hypothetical protein